MSSVEAQANLRWSNLNRDMVVEACRLLERYGSFEMILE